MNEMMLDLLQSLPADAIRGLLAMQNAHGQVADLMQKRDELLARAEEVQKQIDQLFQAIAGGNLVGTQPGYTRKRQGPTLKDLCEQVMLEANEPLTAAQVKDVIMERWPEKNRPTLYNQIFISLQRSQITKKVAKGKFAVREGARREKETGSE